MKTPKFSTLLSVILAGLTGLLLVVGCGTKPPDQYQGYVEGDFVNVASSQPGRLDSVMVQRGSTVAANAPLFSLDAQVESAVLRQSEQQLLAARSQLEDLQQGRRPQEIDVIQAQLAQAEANEKLTQSTLRREDAVFESGGVSREQLEVVRTQADQAAARVRELRNQLKVASLPARSDQVQAQAALVQAAQAAYDQAKWRLDQKAVSAVTGGLVYDVLYEVGEWVPTGAPVVRLLPPANLKLRFYVPETHLGKLSPGQSVLVTIDGRTGELPATISYISASAEFTPPIIYSNETRSKLVFMVEARPADGATRLNVGQPVSVRLP